MDKIECYGCHEFGHRVANCPKKKTPNKNDRARKEVKKSEESPVKSSVPTRKNKRNTRSSAREGGAGSN